MIKNTYRLSLLLVFLFLSSCAITPKPVNSEKTLSILGVMELILPIENQKYWLGEGPFFVLSKRPLVAYRVIDKTEIERLESVKTVYQFITSSFSNPKDIVEKSFFGSHNDYAVRFRQLGRLSIYSLTKADESKAYIVSDLIEVGVEVLVAGEGHEKLMEKILTKSVLI